VLVRPEPAFVEKRITDLIPPEAAEGYAAAVAKGGQPRVDKPRKK